MSLSVITRRRCSGERSCRVLGRCALLVAVILFAGYGCSKSPEDLMIEHMEEMLSLLERHKDNPELAAQEVLAYAESSRPAMERLTAKLEEKLAKMTDDEKEDYGRRMMQRSSAVMERAHKLFTAHPELAQDETLKRALYEATP